MRMIRNIESIDRLDLENRIRRSALFTDPAATADEYFAQIDTVTTDIQNEIAPLRSIRCHGLSSDRKLSPEAMAAKREQRWLEMEMENERSRRRQTPIQRLMQDSK